MDKLLTSQEVSEILGVNQKEIASEKRRSAEMEAKSNIKLNSHSSLDFSKSSIGLKNSKSINEKSEKRTLKSAIKGGREKQQQSKHEYVPPEIYIYNEISPSSLKNYFALICEVWFKVIKKF